MLEKNNEIVLEISQMVNEAKNKLSKEINKSITYTYYIPNKELLINEVEKVLENNK